MVLMTSLGDQGHFSLEDYVNSSPGKPLDPVVGHYSRRYGFSKF
jgi:hypothetical protein